MVYALLSDGAVWGWGEGDWGQLGNGPPDANPQADSCDGESATSGNYCTSVPVEVSGLDDVAAISGGLVQGYALLSDGTVSAWGSGVYGELGNGYSAGD